MTDVEPGDTIEAEYDTVLGETIEESLEVDRVEEHGVVSEVDTAIGTRTRFVPWEAIDEGIWEVV